MDITTKKIYLFQTKDEYDSPSQVDSEGHLVGCGSLGTFACLRQNDRLLGCSFPADHTYLREIEVHYTKDNKVVALTILNNFGDVKDAIYYMCLHLLTNTVELAARLRRHIPQSIHDYIAGKIRFAHGDISKTELDDLETKVSELELKYWVGAWGHREFVYKLGHWCPKHYLEDFLDLESQYLKVSFFEPRELLKDLEAAHEQRVLSLEHLFMEKVIRCRGGLL